ncbi:MAG: HAMP domain-containing histidine kinase [Clostridia bacterium]|nr:HAMP domain-containing histidine kinase [Clostridia bacterium]
MTFSNSAPAMDELMLGRLFDRYYTVETGRGKSELGLSLAKDLAEKIGGTVACKGSGGKDRWDGGCFVCRWKNEDHGQIINIRKPGVRQSVFCRIPGMFYVTVS